MTSSCGTSSGPAAGGHRVERDAPLLRFVGFGNDGFVGYRDLGELDGVLGPRGRRESFKNGPERPVSDSR
jgi:hypothetical protein